MWMEHYSGLDPNESVLPSHSLQRAEASQPHLTGQSRTAIAISFPPLLTSAEKPASLILKSTEQGRGIPCCPVWAPKQLLVDPVALRRGRSEAPRTPLGTWMTLFKKNLPFRGVPERKVTRMITFLFKILLLLKWAWVWLHYLQWERHLLGDRNWAKCWQTRAEQARSHRAHWEITAYRSVAFLKSKRKLYIIHSYLDNI